MVLYVSKQELTDLIFKINNDKTKNEDYISKKEIIKNNLSEYLEKYDSLTNDDMYDISWLKVVYLFNNINYRTNTMMLGAMVGITSFIHNVVSNSKV